MVCHAALSVTSGYELPVRMPAADTSAQPKWEDSDSLIRGALHEEA
jgi:hypothetical protein